MKNNMLKVTIPALLIILIIVTFGFSSVSQLTWYGFDDGILKAKNEDKQILMVVACLVCANDEGRRSQNTSEKRRCERTATRRIVNKLRESLQHLKKVKQNETEDRVAQGESSGGYSGSVQKSRLFDCF